MMAIQYCTRCDRNVETKRSYNVVALFLFTVIPFCWILLLMPPLYSRRSCPLCNSKDLLNLTEPIFSQIEE